MNPKFDKPPREVIAQIKHLTKALIDTSSIIYAHKAGFLNVLQANLGLFTTADVIAEAGTEAQNIELIHCDSESGSVDERLFYCALQNNLPLISEDKKILAKLKQTNLPYFNVLMMLNFLVYIEAIDQDQYSRYYALLKKIAWYSPKIWAHGKSVHRAIEESMEAT